MSVTVHSKDSITKWAPNTFRAVAPTLLAIDTHHHQTAPKIFLHGSEKYVISKILGEGSEGVVYRAKKGDRQYAIKVLNLGTTFESVCREAELIRKINSDQVVKLFDYGTHGDAPYLIMEFVDGQVLHDGWQNHFHSKTFDLLRQITKGISDLESAGVVHRDIKPPNIVHYWKGSLEKFKIIDFGLACSSNMYNPSEFGKVVGTLEYMAPEQCGVDSNYSPTTKSDMYSLGKIALMLLVTNTGVCQESSSSDILSKIYQIKRGVIDPRISLELERFGTLGVAVKKCLSLNPSERPSAGEFLRVLTD